MDTRLRDSNAALDERLSPTLEHSYDASYVSDSVAVRDADIVRLRRQLDGLGLRVRSLEGLG